MYARLHGHVLTICLFASRFTQPNFKRANKAVSGTQEHNNSDSIKLARE